MVVALLCWVKLFMFVSGALFWEVGTMKAATVLSLQFSVCESASDVCVCVCVCVLLVWMNMGKRPALGPSKILPPSFVHSKSGRS